MKHDERNDRRRGRDADDGLDPHTDDPNQDPRDQDDLFIERSLDGELTQQDRIGFKERLLAEPGFRHDYEEVSGAAEMLHELPHADHDPAFVDEVMAHIVLRQGQAALAGDATLAARRSWMKAVGGLAIGLVLGGLVGFLLARQAKPKTRNLQPTNHMAPVTARHRTTQQSGSQAASVRPFTSNRCVTVQATRVRFAIRAPDAHSVSLAGDFTKWSPRKLDDPDSDGIWTITLTLRLGTYHYNFLVDGSRWVTDPTADGHRPDGFGGYNSVIRL
ncbi:MAG: isoamylase early set domain-containing protein [Deltaproteobacteria bacterium]|nr:isoamylase early set domain-containing protein [Deltaproteobacteria bacterium]